MTIINNWILTDTNGRQWTFEENVYEDGLTAQKEYLINYLSGSRFTLEEAESLIINGTWRMEPIEQI